MNKSIEWYRERFAVIPEEHRRAVIGKEWKAVIENLTSLTNPIRRTLPDGEDTGIEVCQCPLGVVLTSLTGQPLYAPPASLVASTVMNAVMDSQAITTWDRVYQAASEFVLNWDDNRMTVEEMEAIFA